MTSLIQLFPNLRKLYISNIIYEVTCSRSRLTKHMINIYIMEEAIIQMGFKIQQEILILPAHTNKTLTEK
jgi:hypothetical protein